MPPILSKHYLSRKPSAIREAQITFSKRLDKDTVNVINLAIGNITLPIHPSMKKRLDSLGITRFKDGVIKYTPTVGTKEAQDAFINILKSENINVKGIDCLITDGGSAAMELMLLGVCGPASEKPIMLLDPTYTNYDEFSKRLSIPTITSNRTLNNDGSFEPLDIDLIESIIKEKNPLGIVIIPYDNPSGQYLDQKTLIDISKICVKNNMWIISDEAYRSLVYEKNVTSSSIWRIREEEVPGIKGRRISIESASKVWNACGLRIGALLTDNNLFHEKATSEYTANLSANAIGQDIFGALAHESTDSLSKWYNKQKLYYKSIMFELRDSLIKAIPGLIVSKPQASIYIILDFKNICTDNFNVKNFTHYCAKVGKVKIKDKYYTLLLAPMEGFYKDLNRGKTQMRLAVVEPSEKIKYTPIVLKTLLDEYFLKNT